MAREISGELESALTVVLQHMLKWDQPADRRTSARWALTIAEYRAPASRTTCSTRPQLAGTCPSSGGDDNFADRRVAAARCGRDRDPARDLSRNIALRVGRGHEPTVPVTGPRALSADPDGGATSRTRRADDLYTWSREQAHLLREGRLGDADALHVAEEHRRRDEASTLAISSRAPFGGPRGRISYRWDLQPTRRTRSSGSDDRRTASSRHARAAHEPRGLKSARGRGDVGRGARTPVLEARSPFRPASTFIASSRRLPRLRGLDGFPAGH